MPPDNIFLPLEMKRTTFVQPLPEELKPLMSNGYDRASSAPKPFEFVEAFPAGSVSATARDMCNFMIAHLQNGQFGSVQILRPETATLMHSRLFGTDDRMNGMAHGFYEESANGHRIIGHGGDTRAFSQRPAPDSRFQCWVLCFLQQCGKRRDWPARYPL